MATLSEFRARYPQYNDMSDADLANALYRKYYSDMPRAEFNQKIGMNQPMDPPMTWADTAVDVAQQSILGLNRGVNNVISIPGEIVGGAVNMVAPGEGDRFKWDNAFSRAFTRPDIQPRTKAGRYAASIGEAFGSSAIPMVGIAAKAAQVAKAAHAARQATNPLTAAGQQIVNAYRAAPGAAVAADAAASVGAGVGQQMAQEGGFGATGQMVGGVLGSLVPAGVVGMTGGTMRTIQRARANQGEPGAYGRIADDLPGGVRELADQIAGGRTRAQQAVNQETFDILGEEMARAGGNVAQAQQATIDRLVREAGLTPAAARARIRTLSQVHENSQLMLGEYPAVARADAAQRGRQPGNIDLDQLGRIQDSTTQAKLDYLANNGNAQSAQNVRNAIAQREEALSPAMSGNLMDSGPQMQTGQRTSRPANIADVEQMVANADQLASQEYRAAYQGPINNQVMLQTLPRFLSWAERRAAMRAGEPAAAINRAVNQFYTQTPNGRLAMMTLQQLQDARAAVRGQMTEYRNAGRNDLINAVQPLYSQITRLMEQMSPMWAQANRRWADGRMNDVAAELGDAFSKRAGPRFREQLNEFNRMAPEAQNIVRVHWIQQQLDRLASLPDSASVSRFFSNDHARTMVRALLGDEAAVSFARMVRDIRVAEASKGMLRNSATHRRGQAQKQMDAETGLQAAIQAASVRGARNWLVERAAQILTENRNRPMADILTTPMSDTAQVAMHLHRMQQQANRLAQFSQPRLMQPAAAGRLAPNANVSDQ